MAATEFQNDQTELENHSSLLHVCGFITLIIHWHIYTFPLLWNCSYVKFNPKVTFKPVLAMHQKINYCHKKGPRNRFQSDFPQVFHYARVYPQMRTCSPSSTWVQRHAWAQIRAWWWWHPVTRAACHSSGSGDRGTDSSMSARRCAWPWLSNPRRFPWLTVAPTSCCRGAAWMETFTRCTRWPW